MWGQWRRSVSPAEAPLLGQRATETRVERPEVQVVRRSEDTWSLVETGERVMEGTRGQVFESYSFLQELLSGRINVM